MVETITPVVYGGRARWMGALVLHALGAMIAAGMFGATLGAIGRMLGAPWGRAGLLGVTLVAGLYALGELTPLRVPFPQLRRQVPDWWRTFFGRPIAATLYGAGLGVGFLTYLANGTLAAVSVAAIASGRPWVGALIVAPFGFVLGVSASVAFGVGTPDQGRALVDRLASSSPERRRVANGAVLVALAVTAAAVSSRAATGRWWSFAAAGIALVFAWSAIAKVARPRRWRRALETYRLGAIEPLASWFVPAAEALVALLVIAGRAREAAALAIILIIVFSAAIARSARARGRWVACGCIVGDDSVDVRWALLRNAGLAAAACLVVANTTDVPFSWPIPLRGAEVAPFLLAAGSMLGATILGWRVAVWLMRGRPA